MKRINVAVTLVGLMLLLASCKKDEAAGCTLLRADIIRYDCDRVILKVHSAELVGDAEWTDVVTGRSYTNVISYYSPCKVVELTHCVKTTIYVSLYGRNVIPADSGCPVQCQAISSSPPQTSYLFSTMQTAPCEPAS